MFVGVQTVACKHAYCKLTFMKIQYATLEDFYFPLCFWIKTDSDPRASKHAPIEYLNLFVCVSFQ